MNTAVVDPATTTVGVPVTAGPPSAVRSVRHHGCSGRFGASRSGIRRYGSGVSTKRWPVFVTQNTSSRPPALTAGTGSLSSGPTPVAWVRSTDANRATSEPISQIRSPWGLRKVTWVPPWASGAARGAPAVVSALDADRRWAFHGSGAGLVAAYWTTANPLLAAAGRTETLDAPEVAAATSMRGHDRDGGDRG